MSDKFVYAYSAPTKSERREIENIKRCYPPAEREEQFNIARAEAMKKVKKLHRLAHTLPKAIAIILAIAGVLIFGGGMSLCLQFENYWAGVPIGVAGIVLVGFVHLIYVSLLKRGIVKYGSEIVGLCEMLLNEKE